MRNRKSVLTDLVSFRGELSELKKELSQYSLDAEEPFLVISKFDFSNLLEKCIKDELTFEDIVDWANVIELRDDLDFEVAEMQEIIFELASPEIHGAITYERLQEIIKYLKD